MKQSWNWTGVSGGESYSITRTSAAHRGERTWRGWTDDPVADAGYKTFTVTQTKHLGSGASIYTTQLKRYE